jgi:hypothetical protein
MSVGIKLHGIADALVADRIWVMRLNEVVDPLSNQHETTYSFRKTDRKRVADSRERQERWISN